MTGAHPEHEKQRLNWPIFLPLFRLIMYRGSLKKSKEAQEEAQGPEEEQEN